MSSKDQHQFDTVFASLTKKEPRTEAAGGPPTEPLTKKSNQTLPSNLEAKLEETPQTLTLSSPNHKKKKTPSPQLPNSSHPILANHPSNLDHWLAQWHKSHQPPLSLTAWWPEPWELEYPPEETLLALKESSKAYSPRNTVEEMEVEMILLNLTDKILENAKKEGWEVVEVEMNQTQEAVVEAVEEAHLIQQAAEKQLTQGHYQTK